MTVTQQNIIIKDVPGDWVEIIYVSGLTIPKNSNNFAAVTSLKAGSHLKCILSQNLFCTTSNNSIIIQPQNADNSKITYGQIIQALGFNVFCQNLDTVNNETAFFFLMVLYGG